MNMLVIHENKRFVHVNDLAVDEEFGRDYGGRKETGGGVEKADASLFADVGDVAEVPRDEVIDLVERRECDVHRVGEELSVKDAA